MEMKKIAADVVDVTIGNVTHTVDLDRGDKLPFLRDDPHTMNVGDRSYYYMALYDRCDRKEDF